MKAPDPSLSRPVKVPRWSLFAFALALLALGMTVRRLKKRQRPKVVTEGGPSFEDLLPTLVGVTHGALVRGNSFTLLQNGAFWDAALAEIEKATQSIHFETFLWKPGELSDRLIDALTAKATAGVPVRVLMDYSGTIELRPEDFERLREGKCSIKRYHPYSLGNLGILNNRDHRKIIIVDGCIGFVGGHCVVDNWLGDAEDKDHFRDISVRMEGPIVQQLQGVFAENWVEETGEIFSGEACFPKLEPRGDTPAHIAYVTAAGLSSDIEVLHYLAIESSKKSITIQNPYFLPDKHGTRALTRAARRGVDVRIMLPSAKVTDMPVVQHASHHRFGAFLKGGIRIYEYQRSLLHQKAITIDGVWSGIGSTNFDNRSFKMNDEITLGIADREVARALEETFERDLAYCDELTYEEWLARSVRHKLIDGLGFAVRKLL